MSEIMDGLEVENTSAGNDIKLVKHEKFEDSNGCNADSLNHADNVIFDLHNLQLTSDEFDIRGAYPFLSDAKTIEYVRKSKVMFIMRGPPGCGKSSVVELIKQLYPNVVVCSADEFFYKEDRTYCRETDKLGDAHTFCQSKAGQAVRDNKLHITIDNTNIRVWEMKHYFCLAQNVGYTVLLIIPQTPWAFDAQQLAKLNTHGVPFTDIKLKVEKFQEALPCFWGWFLNDDDSEQLRTLGVKYFNDCIRVIEEFPLFLPRLDDGSIHSFGDVYNSLRRNTNLHCTSYFAGYRSKSVAVVRYAHGESVSRSMGLVFTLTITGIFFTPRSAGLRVSLTEEQFALFNEQDEEVRESGKYNGTPTDNVLKVRDKKRKKDKRKSRKNLDEGVIVMDKNDDILDKSTNTSCGTCDRKDSVLASPVKSDKSELCVVTMDHGKGQKAHITIGFSNTSHAAQTGQELWDIIACESTGLADKIVSDDQASISYYGEGRCMVMFHQPILIDSLFSGRF